MFVLLFKLKRKIKQVFKKQSSSFKLFEWRTIYSNRFFPGKGMSFGKLFAVYFDASSSVIRIGEGVQFRDFCQLRSGMNGSLVIGERVFFNNNCSINCMHEIVIGNDCQFGEGVKFYDHNHQYKNKAVKINEQGYATGRILVGNNCWFGSDVIILKDVEIGDNVIIGAGCIIHQSIPSNSKIINIQQIGQLS